MKCIIFTLSILWHTSMLSQYSNYYSNIYIGQQKTSQSKVDVNANISQNVNANLNISGNIVEQKHITTIDYGALELANAQREKNRLEQQIYADRREKEIADAIAQDPLKAFEYGYPYSYCMKDFKKQDKNTAKEMTKQTGIKDFCIHYVIPNNKLFSIVGSGKYQNVSSDGVITELIFFTPNFYKDESMDLEREMGFENEIVGKENEFEYQNKKFKYFVHMKDLRRADVFGTFGFKGTLITEDKYEIGITDHYKSTYNSSGKGYISYVSIVYKGDKKEVTFEQLEGRRYYFRNLIQKLTATGFVDKIKY